MLLFAVDDEKPILEGTKDTLLKACEGAEVMTFSRGDAALEAISQGKKPDVVFSDIEMPGLSGLEFAVKLKSLSPETKIVFVTGHDKYAVNAFKIKANGYLLKPISVEDVREELSYMPEPREADKDKLVVKCFGHFDVYWNGEPVIFTRKQSKELLAYLIDRRGAVCTAEEIGLALWEDGHDKKVVQQRVRNLLSDLKSTLGEIGMEDVIIRKHRQIAIHTEMIDCDYYRLLEGDMDVVNSYQGEYLKDYSWAELTNGELYFNK